MQQSLYNETLKDKFTLSPFEKYVKYGRIPYKFILGCLLVFLTSLQVIFISQHYLFNSPDQIQQWSYIFLGAEDAQNNRQQYKSIVDFQSSLSKTLEQLKNLESLMIQETRQVGKTYVDINYEYPYDEYINDNKFQYLVTDYTITQPFDINDIQSMKYFWSRAYALTLNIMDLEIMHEERTICWDIYIQYRLVDYGIIDAELRSNGGVCSDLDQIEHRGTSEHGESSLVGWDSLLLQILIIITATGDMVLGVKYIYEVIQMYTNNIYKQSKMRKLQISEYKLHRNKNLTTLKIILSEQKPWDQLNFQEKLLFFDLFLPIRILGNIFQIIASSVLIFEGFIRIDDISDYDQLFVGMGCFFAWFNMVKYLDYYEELHLIASVLESSIIPLCMAILNFLPVFFGYTFLALCLFNESMVFSTLQSTTSALISLIYGDSISDVIRGSSKGVDKVLSMIFIISYILLFIFAVNNIMIALIKEQQEQKKDLINMEKDLMNQLDIKDSNMKKSVSQPPTSQMNLIDSSASVLVQPEKQMTKSVSQEKLSQSIASVPNTISSKKQMGFKQVAQLAILLNRSKDATHKQIENDWKKEVKQEMHKNYMYNALIQTVNQLKHLLGEIEKELWADLDQMQVSEIEKRELISLYCSSLIKQHQALRDIYNRTAQMQIKLTQTFELTGQQN